MNNDHKPLVRNFAKPHVCIDQWEIINYWGNGDRLRGIVRNHPYIPDGEIVITSSIVNYDPSGCWIETLSTIYILGIPHGVEGDSQSAVVNTNEDWR